MRSKMIDETPVTLDMHQLRLQIDIHLYVIVTFFQKIVLVLKLGLLRLSSEQVGTDIV